MTETLFQQWPCYLTYVVGLLAIGAMWINHHALPAKARMPDRILILLNVLLLTVVAAVFWATGFLYAQLRDGPHATNAAPLYGILLTIHALVHVAMRRRVTRSEASSCPRPSPIGGAARSSVAVGSVAYPAALALSLLSPVAMLVTYGLLAVYYAVNPVPAPHSA